VYAHEKMKTDASHRRGGCVARSHRLLGRAREASVDLGNTPHKHCHLSHTQPSHHSEASGICVTQMSSLFIDMIA
jgi:hypothetical protein